jgi:CelD/BcsL family acetyltransferase involved in cellulose biosynthesis
MDEIEIIAGAEAILRLGPLWTEAAGAEGARAFTRFALVAEAARLAEQQGSLPLVAVVRTSEGAATLLPLRRERYYGARAAVPLVQPLAQYADVVGGALTPSQLARVCEALGAHNIDLLLLRKVRSDSGLHEALAARGRSQRAEERALYIDLSAYASFEAYDASFSSPTRRNRRQRRQKLEAAAGPLSFEVLSGPAAEGLLDRAIAWKRAWLSARGISSPVFDGGPWEKLLRSTVSSGAATVSCLSAGQNPAAIEIGFVDGTTYISYLGAFDAALAAYSPGQEQMLRTIGWCFGKGLSRYDLLAPADDYKRQWTRRDTGVAIDDYAIALTQIGRGLAEVRRHVRPLARDLYLSLTPEMRAASGAYGVPAAAAAAAAVCAGVVLATLE